MWVQRRRLLVLVGGPVRAHMHTFTYAAGDPVNVSFGDEAPPLVPQTLADADMLNSVLTAQYEYPVVNLSSKAHCVRACEHTLPFRFGPLYTEHFI
jgi:hypothetical protein